MSTYLTLVAEKVLDKLPAQSVFKREATILSSRMKATGKTIKDAIYRYGLAERDGK
jgi:hypothetical protein